MRGGTADWAWPGGCGTGPGRVGCVLDLAGCGVVLGQEQGLVVHHVHDTPSTPVRYYPSPTIPRYPCSRSDPCMAGYAAVHLEHDTFDGFEPCTM